MREAPAKQGISAAWLSGAAYAGMFGFGIVMALLGAVLPVLAQRLAFDLGRAGDLFLVMNAGMLATTLAVGPLLDRFGHKPPLVIAPLLVAAALALVAQVSTFDELVGAVLLLGIGGGALNQVTNTLIADLYFDEHAKGAALNVLGVFFGFGALFVPFAIASALRTVGLRQILYLATALSLLPVVLSVPFAFPAPRQRQGVSLAQMMRLVRQSLVLAFSFLLFFESGNEFILGGYLSTYLTRELRVTVPAASYVLAAYWASLMLGRIILSRVLLRKTSGTVVRSSALGVAASMSLLLLSPSPPFALACTILLGLSVAAIFPTVLGIAGSCYASHSGTVFSILVGTALIGGMTMPWLVGRIADAWDIRRALFLVVLNAVAIFGLGLAAQRMLREQENTG